MRLAATLLIITLLLLLPVAPPRASVPHAGAEASAPEPGAGIAEAGDRRRTVVLGTPNRPLPPGGLEWSAEGWAFASPDWSLALPERADGTSRVTTTSGASLRFRSLEMQGSPPDAVAGLRDAGDTARLDYFSVHPGVDETFLLTPRGLKHDIVLNRPPGGDPDGDLALAWFLELSPGLVPVVDERPAGSRAETRGSILIRNADGGYPFAVEPPRAFPASLPGDPHVAGFPGTYVLERLEEGWRLELRLPMSWLLDPRTAYPVRIDPTVTVWPGDDAHTGWVSWDDRTGTGYDRSLGAIDSGTLVSISPPPPSPQWHVVNGFARFDTSVIPDNATVLSVRLEVWVSNHDNLETIPPDPAVPLPMQIHDVDEDPLVAGDSVLFNAIRTGPVLVAQDIPRTGPHFCADSYRFFNWNLPFPAPTNLQALLADDWYAIGFTSEIVTDPGFDHIDYIGYPEIVQGACGTEFVPGWRIRLVVDYLEANEPPVCEAGGPYNEECQGGVTRFPVNGTGSFDPDGDPLEFLWTTDCPGGVFDDPTAPATFLTVQTGGECETACSAILEVSDEEFRQSCAAPVFISDGLPPEILDCPQPLTRECNEPGGLSRDDPAVQRWLNAFDSADLCNGVTETNDAPPFFPFGCPPGLPTPVAFTATDGCGQSNSCQSELIVVDSTPPDLTVPLPDTIECTEPGGVSATDPRVQNWLALAVATDLCDQVTQRDDAPAFFPSACDPGLTTTVTFEAEDGCGNLSSHSSGLTVVDTSPPSLRVPPPLELECTGPGGVPATDPRIQSWLSQAQVADMCGTPTLRDDAPSFFPSGCGAGQVTTVTFTATDECGNEVSLPSTVTVRDTEAPVLQVPPPLELECSEAGGVSGQDQRILDWLASASATELCGTATVTNDAPSFFPSACTPGQATTVTFTASDECGNQASLTSTVTVQDTEAPELRVPPPLELECNEPGGVSGQDQRILDWLASASATDVCGTATVMNDAPSFFPSACTPGQVTTVTFTATDDCGNATRLTSTVTVRDTEAPDLQVPAPLDLECNEPGGVSASDSRIQAWLASALATDTCGTATVGNDAPSFFPSACEPGRATTVTFTATDECGNERSLTSTVTVRDTEAPDLQVPSPLELECDSQGGIPATDGRIQSWLGSATAADVCGTATVTHDAPAFFPSACDPGQVTTVTFTATDGCGNTATASSTVTVKDTTPPDLTVPPPITLECSAPGGVPRSDREIQDWLGSASAVDLCDGAEITDDGPDLFPASCPPGTPTVVTFTAVDECGNATQESSTVTVVDSTPPVIEGVDFDGACLWSPNHKYFCIEDVTGMVHATDVCDPDPPARGVAECSSSQPEDDLGDGHTFQDCAVVNGGAGFCARSERQGIDPAGRDYGVVVFAADQCGNTSTSEAALHVPHDQSPRRKDCYRANAGKDLDGR